MENLGHLQESSFKQLVMGSSNAPTNWEVGGTSRKSKRPRSSSIGEFSRESSRLNIEKDQGGSHDAKAVSGGWKGCNAREKLSDSHAKVQKVLKLFRKKVDELRNSNYSRANNVYVNAAKELESCGHWINTSRRLGPVPGVEIGDIFLYRAEMRIVGLHCQFEKGIDYTKKDGITVATSIVATPRYANYMPSLGVLVYIGEGGNPSVHSDQKVRDQKLGGGNLALVNSKKRGMPVRVIRVTSDKMLKEFKLGDTISLKSSDMVYFYDGLYTVEDFKQVRSEYGKLVFKFVLKKIPGQKLLPWDSVYEFEEFHKEGLSVDNSQGREKISTRNLGDKRRPSACEANGDGLSVNNSPGREKISTHKLGDKRRPSARETNAHGLSVYNSPGREKISTHKLGNKRRPSACETNAPHPGFRGQSMSSGCYCTHGCCKDCSCKIKKEGETASNYSECAFGNRSRVNKCGTSCKCCGFCNTRVSPRHDRFQLEAFKIGSGQWSVRSRSYIPAGSIICEYANVSQPKEADPISGGKCLQPFPICRRSDSSFAIRSGQYRYLGRMINHSSCPNLYLKKALLRDDKMPCLVLCAIKDIYPFDELTCDRQTL